jgi:hypothetical protein
MTTPTDGEWMSAYEALEFLRRGMPFEEARNTIFTHALHGLIKARASRFVRVEHSGGPQITTNDAEIPAAFWWTESGPVLEQNWRDGNFKPTQSDHAFGVTFLRSHIEALAPANPRPAPAQRPAGRAVFIGHGHSLQWLSLDKFLRERLLLSPVEFNSTSAAGLATSERLRQMRDQADFAFLIFTGEDEQSDGKLPRA